jgi:hypothetical protein
MKRRATMKSLRVMVISMVMCLVAWTAAIATPSTQIWNPSTDIQASGTSHLGIDNYFTLTWPQDGGYAYPTDIGLTYGLMPGIEIGIDSFTPTPAQYTFNAKYAIPETGDIPSMAVGGLNFGSNVDADKRNIDQSIWYAVAAKTFDLGRLTGGYYTGNDHVLVDNNGDKANTGFIFTWDKAITDKLWACVDYASGYSAYGAAFYGLSWMFSPNTSVIFGYGTFNNGAKPAVTTQLDINF